jgi:hypothetical protein
LLAVRRDVLNTAEQPSLGLLFAKDDRAGSLRAFVEAFAESALIPRSISATASVEYSMYCAR